MSSELQRTKQILVTGAAGFIGFHFVRRLLASEKWEGFQIRVLDSLTYAASQEHADFLRSRSEIEFVQCDITDIDALRGVFGHPQYVVNFAAESHVDNSLRAPLTFAWTNYIGTANLLEISREMGVRRFLQVSTDEVYGSLLTGSAKESDTLRPSSPYSASKAAADQLVLAYSKSFDLDCVITRCCNNYGPGQHGEKFLPTVLRCLANDLVIPIYGNGQNMREWIHVFDHVKGVESALLRGQSGEVYNLGSSEILDNLSLVALASRVLGVEAKVVHVQDRPGHDFRYSIDSDKARRSLGFTPVQTLERYLKDVLENSITRP